MSKKFLTLNIGASTVELAEYEAGAKGELMLVNYGVAKLAAPLDGGNAETILSPALMEIVREKGIRPGKVAIAVSGQMVFPRFAAVPLAGGNEKFEQMIRYEIEQNIPFPIDAMVCDHQVLGETENGDKSVMIVAAKIDQVEALTSAISAVGFEPELVDVSPIALTNVMRFNSADGEECKVLLDIGAKTTSLVIVEGDKLYNRSIPVAGNTITKEIATALGCTMEEAEALKLEKGYVSMGGVSEDEDEVADGIAKAARAVLTRLHAEISRSINFYRGQQHGGTPTRLYLTGGSALLPQIDDFFRESLQIEVEFFNPFERIAIGPKVDSSALEKIDGAVIATTAGLALHLAKAARFSINLLPPSIIQAKAERARVPFIAIGGATLALALVLVGIGVKFDAAVIDAKREGIEGQVAALDRCDKAIKTVEAKYKTIEAEAEALRKLLADRAATVQRVNAVRNSILAGTGMWIERWDANGVTFRYWFDRMKKNNGGKPVGELVADKIKHSGAVDADSKVVVNNMIELGKDDTKARQFSVEFKFK